MRLFVTRFILLTGFLCTAILAGAQSKFYATASPEKAGAEEYVTYRLVFDNAQDIGEINTPRFQDFVPVSGPNQEVQAVFVNGVMRRTVSFSYVLLPKKKGKFQIQPAYATIAGKKCRSNSVWIEITDKPAAVGNHSWSTLVPSPFEDMPEPKKDKLYDDYLLKPGEDAATKIRRNMKLDLQVNKKQCYAGEPVVATYRLCTRLRSQSNISKNPSFNGFSVIDMTSLSDPSQYTVEKSEGRDYNVYTLRKAQLYPLRSGDFELENAVLDNQVSFVKPDGFGSGKEITANLSLESKPLLIHVLPLPEKGKPAGFKDAVGQFAVRAEIDQQKLQCNQSGKLLISVQGKGNMQMITLPDIKWPNGVEVFEAKVRENIDVATVPLSGIKQFEVPFTVSKPGTYTLPAISFSFFDPETATYRTATTKPQQFSAAPANAKTVMASGKKNETSGGVSPGLLIGGVAAGSAALALLAYVLLTRRKKEEEFVSEEPITLAKDLTLLSKSESCLQFADCAAFYDTLCRELKQQLADRYDLSPERSTLKSLLSEMDRRGAANHLVLETELLISELEQLLYTPFAERAKMNELYARSKTLLEALDRSAAPTA